MPDEKFRPFLVPSPLGSPGHDGRAPLSGGGLIPNRVMIVQSALALLVLLEAPALAKAPAQQPRFKVDFQMAGADGVSVHGKLSFGGARIRMEIADGGGMGTLLVDNVKHTQVMLPADEKMYMEMPGAMADASRAPRVDVLDPGTPAARGRPSAESWAPRPSTDGYATEKWELKAHI